MASKVYILPIHNTILKASIKLTLIFNLPLKILNVAEFEKIVLNRVITFGREQDRINVIKSTSCGEYKTQVEVLIQIQSCDESVEEVNKFYKKVILERIMSNAFLMFLTEFQMKKSTQNVSESTSLQCESSSESIISSEDTSISLSKSDQLQKASKKRKCFSDTEIAYCPLKNNKNDIKFKVCFFILIFGK